MQVRLYSVEHIAADEHGLGPYLLQDRDHAPREACATDIAQVHICHKRGAPAMPDGGKIGQLDGDAGHAQP